MQFEGTLRKLFKYSSKIFRISVVSGYVMMAVLMYVRAFFGTEITDEAYYVAEAKAILEGNIPFARNTSLVSGFGLFLAPIVALYRYLVPDMEGLFLTTRLCFVTLKLLVSIVAYGILAKNIKKEYALILAALVLTFYGNVQNFSYNTVPQLFLLLSGVLLYDVLEQDGKQSNIKIVIAGAATTVSCFANPGWGFAFVIFVCLTIMKVLETKQNAGALKIYLLACFATAGLIISWVLLNTSSEELLVGVSRTYINPVPFDSLNPKKTWMNIVQVCWGPFKIWVSLFLPAACFIYLFSLRYIREGATKLSREHCLTFSIAMAMLIIAMAMLMHGIYLVSKAPKFLLALESGKLGFMIICWGIIFFLSGHYKREKIVLYLAIYPVTYSIAVLFIGEVSISIVRFLCCIVSAIPILYVLFRNRSELVRLTATAIAVFLLVDLVYLVFHDVYRDANMRKLVYKVESGIYKGIYTTKTRAHDLPEMERSLNRIIAV